MLRSSGIAMHLVRGAIREPGKGKVMVDMAQITRQNTTDQKVATKERLKSAPVEEQGEFDDEIY